MHDMQGKLQVSIERYQGLRKAWLKKDFLLYRVWLK